MHRTSRIQHSHRRRSLPPTCHRVTGGPPGAPRGRLLRTSRSASRRRRRSPIDGSLRRRTPVRPRAMPRRRRRQVPESAQGRNPVHIAGPRRAIGIAFPGGDLLRRSEGTGPTGKAGRRERRARLPFRPRGPEGCSVPPDRRRTRNGHSCQSPPRARGQLDLHSPAAVREAPKDPPRRLGRISKRPPLSRAALSLRQGFESGNSKTKYSTRFL